MKVTVRLDDRLFDVEIANLHLRPIVATVEGDRFEIWPETSFPPPGVVAGSRPVAGPSAAPAAPRSSTPAPCGPSAIHAPIPGVIISVAVKPGDALAVGQEVCVLEAMKMKNVIRAPRAGVVERVAVSDGQHVQHHDVLIEFSE